MPWTRVHPGTVFWQLSLASFSLLLGVLRWCWVPLWLYHPLPAYCTGSFLSYWVTCRYLTFLAVDWLRTVSASPLFLVLLVWFVCLSSRFPGSFFSGFSPIWHWACVGRSCPLFPSPSFPPFLGAFLIGLFASGAIGLPYFAGCFCVPVIFLVICHFWLFCTLGFGAWSLWP